MPVIKVNDIAMHYEQYGHGADLVLIAGYAADLTTWSEVVHLLAKHFRVTIFDNRGVGQSDASQSPYKLEQMAEDVAHLLAKLHIKKAHVLGHSMGGKIALRLALDYPEIVDRLVIVSCKCGKLGFPLLYLSTISNEMLTQGASLDLVLRNFFAWLYGEEFLAQEAKVKLELNRMVRQAMGVSAQGQMGQKAAGDVDLLAEISTIQMPTLVIAGKNDVLIAPHHSDQLTEKLPQARLYKIEACGHMPQIEKPEELTKQIIDFLR